VSEIPTVRSLATVWLSLLLLVAVTTASAYLSLGIGNTIVNFVIAAIKVLLIGAFFMHLRHADATTRLAASTALFLLLVLAFLSFGDFLTRSTQPAQWKAPLMESNSGGSYDIH
jgi:caa(3)-type oxidase subunit IV